MAPLDKEVNTVAEYDSEEEAEEAKEALEDTLQPFEKSSMGIEFSIEKVTT